MEYTKAHFAVRHAASKDETRYNLNGIHFESDGSTVATDGHVLIHASPAMDPGATGEAQCSNLEAFELQLPQIEKLRKLIPKAGHVDLDPALTNANGAAHFVTDDGLTYDLPKSDEGYPSWQQVLPKDEPAVTLGLNVVLLERICKAVREFAPKDQTAVKVEVFGELQPVRITSEGPDGELMALLMPMRI